ncbi:MAG: Gfo/Idh/MocA family protein [Longimicrobiales bacterium]
MSDRFRVLPVLEQRRIRPRSFAAHFAEKYARPLRKGLLFAALEGPRATLRKRRSKLVERSIEADQHIVLAALRGADGEQLIGLTRDLGAPLRFERALLFAVDGIADPSRVTLSPHALELAESYLPVPECPVPHDLAHEILAANSWLRASAAFGHPAGAAASERGAGAGAGARTGVYLVGMGGYVREYVLPHFRSAVRMGVDHKAGLIRRHAAPRFPVVADFELLLAAVAAEAAPLVIIASYHSAHARQALAVLDANPRARVFIEKPVCVDAAEATALVARRRDGAWIDVGYNRRYAPLALRLAAEAERVPRPWTLTALVQELRLPSAHWYGWSTQGTRVTGNGCHWLDLFQWLHGGRASRVRVSGTDARFSIGVEYEDGSVATLVASEDGDAAAGVQESIELRGAGATLRLDDFRSLRVERRGRRRTQRARLRDKGHAAMYADLRARWLSGGPPRYPLEDIERVARLTAAAAALLDADAEPSQPRTASARHAPVERVAALS